MAVLALTAAACGGEATQEPDVAPDDAADDVAAEPEEDPAPDPDDGEAADAAAVAGQVAVASTDLGDVLVDGDGMTLYLFDPDEAGESTCYDDCAANWPPLEGPVEAGDGTDPALLGTTDRTDGTLQATYAGWPLYRFVGDGEPGDVTGQGVQEVWWVLSPAGERLTAAAAADSDEDETPPPDPGY